MLTPARKADIDAHIELFYALSQDLTRSSFPTYTDGIKTKSEFFGAVYDGLGREDEELLLYSEDGEVLGLIHYYWIEAEKYLSFQVFNTKRGAARAIDEFLQYAAPRFAGWQIDFGFPKENAEALSHLAALGFRKLEEDECFVLHFCDYEPLPEGGDVVPVTEENYPAFRALHDQNADMYWNSERLLGAVRGETRGPWRLYLYRENGEARGCVYFTYVEDMMEIFGVDCKGGVFRGDVVKKLLIRALNQSKADGVPHATYFAEGEERAVLRDLPFTRVATYVAFTGEPGA